MLGMYKGVAGQVCAASAEAVHWPQAGREGVDLRCNAMVCSVGL